MNHAKNIAQAIAAKLSGVELLVMEMVDKYCNGIGAEWLPGWLRWIISTLNPSCTPSSYIHDLRYVIGGTLWDRIKADWEFFRNNCQMAVYRYRWFDRRRYLVFAVALLYLVILLIFGGTAFNYNNG